MKVILTLIAAVLAESSLAENTTEPAEHCSADNVTNPCTGERNFYCGYGWYEFDETHENYSEEIRLDYEDYADAPRECYDVNICHRM